VRLGAGPIAYLLVFRSSALDFGSRAGLAGARERRLGRSSFVRHGAGREKDRRRGRSREEKPSWLVAQVGHRLTAPEPYMPRQLATGETGLSHAKSVVAYYCSGHALEAEKCRSYSLK
jgi:hypothetical protein